jgi:hypothetical protein
MRVLRRTVPKRRLLLGAVTSACLITTACSSNQVAVDESERRPDAGSNTDVAPKPTFPVVTAAGPAVRPGDAADDPAPSSAPQQTDAPPPPLQTDPPKSTTSAPPPPPAPPPTNSARQPTCAVYNFNYSVPFRLCDRGYFVEEIQRRLNQLGYGLNVDGYFGPNVQSAVRDVQRRSGYLEVDGLVGPNTWYYLFGYRF